jgi:hypothetical protein
MFQSELPRLANRKIVLTFTWNCRSSKCMRETSDLEFAGCALVRANRTPMLSILLRRLVHARASAIIHLVENQFRPDFLVTSSVRYTDQLLK